MIAQEKPLGPAKEDLQRARQKAVNFLRTTQADNGSWTAPDAVGISALVAYGLLSAGMPADDPVMVKTLDFLTANSQADGRICAAASRHSGYETCVALMALKEANSSGKYTPIIERAAKFVRRLQIDETQNVDTSEPRYGGAGYSPDGERPDLSNTAFLVEALRAAGAGPDDPALQKALIFVSRCQNLESEFNTSPAAAQINDGGFFYTSSAGGASPAGTTAEGGLRSYGSMTYAGLKSMIYAGLTPDDPRVRAAIDWIEKHYTVANNPGMGNNGLFYYYQLFAKALDAMNLDNVEDAQGEKHDWRKELATHLFSLQDANGSWVNSSTRWYEGDPNLVTAYSLIALRYCEPRASEQGRP
ncbi:MAG: terpene cyclase/mutase family protein [Planctomycetaceae bacterium]|nr:terpene cyclase/mutase family protein [Planctomycetaceae bacterium]